MNNPRPILLGTSNIGKIAAFRRLLKGLPIRLVTLEEVQLALNVEETGATFDENALLKARAYRGASGMSALADDSGLSVDALGGEPGVHSARYGGFVHSPTAQNLLLLEQLNGVPPVRRGAVFTSVVAFAGSDGHEWTAEGAVRGTITDEIRGSHGFGYDPVFLLPDINQTYAELPPERKDPISHRGKAMDAARAYLERELGWLE